MNSEKKLHMKLTGLGVLGVLFIGLGTVSCTDGFDAMNIPEHQLTVDQMDESLLGQAFAQSLYTGMMGQTEYQVCYNLNGDLYAQYFAHTFDNATTNYFEEGGLWSNRCWQGFYRTPALQQHFVETFTEENAMPIHNAFAKIWRVQIYHRITDYWGPIVYSEFGKGETNVAYDPQDEIYMDFFLTLDEAVATLEQHRGDNAFGTHDILYGGDVDSWIRYANSLRLRLAVRISYVEPEIARQEAEKAVTAGVFEDNSQQALMATTIDSYNWLTEWTYGRGIHMSATMHSLLVGYDDPRLSAYWAEALNRPGYQGLRSGVPPEFKGGNIRTGDHSFVSERYRPLHRECQCGENPPNRVMTTAEVYLLRAEGALRGWNMGGSAEELYNEGIRSSLLHNRPDLSSSEIEAYVNSTNTPVSVSTENYHPEGRESPPVADIPVLYQANADFETQLEQIITQKWIVGWYDGWEAWSERRRTGYPVGYAILFNLSNHVARDELMRRLSFVDDERSQNSAAVQAAEGLLNGPDNNATRLWWDAKPLSDFPVPVD